MDIDHSIPRLRRLLLCSLLIVPAPPSPPVARCPTSTAVAFRPGYSRVHPPTRASLVYVPVYQKPSPAFPHPTLPVTDSSSTTSLPLHLTDSHRRLFHATAKIYCNVDFIYCSADTCCHHVSRYLPPTSYTASFSHTLKIGCRATYSATVVYLLFMYSLRGFFTTA